MRICIFGAGYVGCYVMNRWQKKPVEFVPVTTTIEKIDELEKKPFVLKALLPNQIFGYLEQCTGIVVCVAPKLEEDYRTTYLDTAEWICHLIHARKSPLYLLYTSSTSVYGQHKQIWVDETTSLLPQSHRTHILAQTEQCFLACASRYTKVCIFRLGGIYGPGRELERRACLFSGKEVAGSGKAPTNYVHVEDIARAIEYAFNQQLEGIYNIVSDEHPTRDTLYSHLCSQLHLPSPRWNPSLVAKHVSCHCVSNQKIKQAGFMFERAVIE